MFMRLSLCLGLAALALFAASDDDGPAHLATSAVLGSAWTLSDVVSGTYARPQEQRRKVKAERVAQKPAKASRKKTATTIKVAQAKRGPKRNFADGYRTVCVRLCDGYYFPVSAAASPGEFQRDEATCRASCASPAKLFVYRNKDGSSETMTDLTGMPYDALATAYQYRVSYNSACTCSPAPWTEAAANRHRLYAMDEAAAAGDLAASLARTPLAAAVRSEESAARARSGADLVVASVPHLKSMSDIQRSLTRKAVERTRLAARRAPPPVRVAAVRAVKPRQIRTVRAAGTAPPVVRRVRVVERPRPVRVSDSRSVILVHR